MPGGSVEMLHGASMQRHPSRRQVLPTIYTRPIKHCSTVDLWQRPFLHLPLPSIHCSPSQCPTACQMRWLPASRTPAL
ncbi:hypothetical protein IG631_21632 [Alternaria alternata]|nr:hypothetical protein IG631_21632 [Alternaria alternata]